VAVTEIVKRVQDISGDQLQAYMKSKGWYEDGKIRSVATIWHRHDNEDAEVVLPFSYIKDYRQRLREALSAVALFESREVLEVVGDVTRQFANVISVRVIHADTEDGTIPINDGVLLIAKAKELLLSAAMALNSKKRQFTGPSSKEARTYVDSLLLGQTEVGSYVVNVIAPLQGPQAAQTVGTDQTPLAQAVTLSLVTGLEALEEASEQFEQGGDLQVFGPAVQKGASANMCDALLGFSGAQRNREFEIKITTPSGPMFSSEPKVFTFDADHIEALSRASGYYRDNYVLEDRTIIGFVKKLNRPKGEEAGTITVDTVVADVDRLVQIALSADNYHKAVLAHDRKSYVRCSGDIHVKSKSARLLNARDFSVISENDLF
jgi:hypothetical protein